MLRKIKLYGKLAKFIGHRVLEADVATAAEAVRFLLANWPELERHMADQHYRVSIGSYALALEELHDPAGAAPISFVPVVAGSGGVEKVLIGVAIIAFAIVTAGAGLIPGLGLGFGASTAISIGLVGLSLVVGGVAELLTPTPEIGDQDPQESYSFSGVQNTSRAGLPVPIVYGEMLVGSVVVSAGIDTVQVTV
jgi:predicted phage tail protein